MSGVRAGFVFSHNKKLIAACANLACFQGVSAQTQWTLTQATRRPPPAARRAGSGCSDRPRPLCTQVLEDEAFVRSYVARMRADLLACFEALQAALSRVGVPLSPCGGTLMAWADFRRYLAEESWAAEDALWRELKDRSKAPSPPALQPRRESGRCRWTRCVRPRRFERSATGSGAGPAHDGPLVLPPPPSRTKWTRLVHPSVLIGHVSSV